MRVNPQVQAWYDGLTPDERVEFDQRLVRASKTLSDMRWSKSTNALDQRLLVPRVPRGPKPKRKRHEHLPIEEMDDTPGDAGQKKPRKAKLPDGMDLAGYIKDTLGVRALADFYIDLMNLSPKEARKRGIFMNHKLMAAAWLGDRGWGKPKGDETDKGITVLVVNHADTAVPERPPIRVEAIESKPEVLDADVGRDENQTKALPEPTDIDVEIESLR